MKVQRKLGSTIIIEAEGATVVDVFDTLAALEEIFRPRPCGSCKCNSITYTLRTDKEGNKYRQATCLSCGAEFRFGLKRGPAGILFPQLRDKSGQSKPNGGWVKFNGTRQPDESES